DRDRHQRSGRWLGADRRRGYWSRVRGGRAAAGVFAVLHHQGRWDRIGTRDRQAHGRRARRNGGRREPVAWRGAGMGAAARAGGRAMTRATILVVDDDERMRNTLGVLLRNLGHEPLTAADVAGAEAV